MIFTEVQSVVSVEISSGDTFKTRLLLEEQLTLSLDSEGGILAIVQHAQRKTQQHLLGLGGPMPAQGKVLIRQVSLIFEVCIYP